MYGLTRGMMTLIGAAIAGGLIWFASWIGPMESTSEYWAAMGLVAGAGLVMALSQLAGGWTKWGVPAVSPSVFFFAFLPALVAGGWIVIAAQPEGSAARDRIHDWSGAIGIGGIVTDLTTLVGAIAFALGLVFGLVFDTTGPRYRDEEVEYDRYADEPTAAERDRTAAAGAAHAERRRDPDHRDPDYADSRRERVAVGAPETRDERETPVAPQPEPDQRPRRRSFFRR